MKKWMPSGFWRSRVFWNVIIAGTAVWLWNILVIVTGILVARQPDKSVVTQCYHLASVNWFARGGIYDPVQTMNYLPHFAILFSALDRVPAPWGDILWRLCSVALLATGLARFVGRFCANALPLFFLAATILALPLSAAATRNGQSNVALAGFMLHAAASIASGGWWAAAGLIMMAVIAKPVAIVMALLALAIYRKLWLPMGVCAMALAVFPFLFGPAEYVLGQYHAFFTNLRSCAGPALFDYADITGLLWPFNIQLSTTASLVIRASAGVPALLLCLLGVQRLREPLRALWLLTVAAGYLMLFNPKSESNGYVILAPVLATWAVFFLRQPGRHWMGWAIAIMAFSMGILPNIVRPWFGNKFALVYHPSMTILFLAMLAAWLCRGNGTAPSLIVEAAGETNSPTDSKEPVVS